MRVCLQKYFSDNSYQQALPVSLTRIRHRYTLQQRNTFRGSPIPQNDKAYRFNTNITDKIGVTAIRKRRTMLFLIPTPDNAIVTIPAFGRGNESQVGFICAREAEIRHTLCYRRFIKSFPVRDASAPSSSALTTPRPSAPLAPHSESGSAFHPVPAAIPPAAHPAADRSAARRSAAFPAEYPAPAPAE